MGYIYVYGIYIYMGYNIYMYMGYIYMGLYIWDIYIYIYIYGIYIYMGGYKECKLNTSLL